MYVDLDAITVYHDGHHKYWGEIEGWPHPYDNWRKKYPPPLPKKYPKPEPWRWPEDWDPEKIWPKNPKPKDYPRPWTRNIICQYCGEDSGIPQVLFMVIPPGGLRCHNCGRVIVISNQYYL